MDIRSMVGIWALTFGFSKACCTWKQKQGLDETCLLWILRRDFPPWARKFWEFRVLLELMGQPHGHSDSLPLLPYFLKVTRMSEDALYLKYFMPNPSPFKLHFLFSISDLIINFPLECVHENWILRILYFLHPRGLTPQFNETQIPGFCS